jgi:serine/threonine protein kinase
MGTVYEAERLADGAVVALKLVPLAGADEKTRRRLMREVRAGATIESPHVARALDSGEDEATGHGFIAFELARGPTLDVFVREHPALPLAVAAELLSGLGDALAAAHRSGIVHRDLKPENLRVEERASGAHLWVLDFGIAKAISALDASATAPGLGTPLWVAPEQSREGYVPVPSADVWAFGLVAFFVLTGRFYWRHAEDASSLADLALELVKSPIEAASVRARQLGVERALPAGFDAWFARAVHRDPSARLPDAGAASRALEDVLRALPAERGGPVVERPGWLLFALLVGCAGMGYAISRIVQGK